MRTHLLTGAGSGMGVVLAEELLGRGDDVVLVARNAQRAEELREQHPGAHTLVADLADPAGVESALSHADLPDRLDTLVHLAGVVDLAPVAEFDLTDWQRQLDVNLTSPAVLTRALLPALRSARGLVVFVNSGAGLTAHPTWSAYAASKHGLRALADSLRGEEGESGVRVTTVYPGRTATPMQEKVHDQESKQYDPSDWIAPASVVSTILHVMDLPLDAVIPDVAVRPGPARHKSPAPGN